MKIVIAVDLQNDFITGSLGSPEAQAIIPNVKDYLRSLDEKDHVIFTMDTHFDDYLESGTMESKKLPIKHTIKGTDGWLIFEDLTSLPPGPQTLAPKQTFCSWDFNDIIVDEVCDYLKNNENFEEDLEFEIFGVCTDICVISIALYLRSFYPSVKITCLKDLCAGSSPAAHETALTVMKSCMIDIA
jgi:nicotinamidase-related amidase